MLSISPSGLCVYNDYLPSRSRRHLLADEDDLIAERPEPIRKRPATNLHDGTISPKARKRIDRAIKWLLYLSPSRKVYNRDSKKWVKYRVCFATFTLSAPQRHSDNDIKRLLLYQLLDELRKRYNVTHYVWRAEKQSNGNIHFHLLINKFIPHTSLRIMWNRIQNKLGYVDDYSAKMSTTIHNFTDYYNMFISQGTYIQLMRRYTIGKATGWRNPNSVDIHGTRHVKNIAAYILKYMAKDLAKEYPTPSDIPEQLKVTGRLWGLSTSLSQLKTITVPITAAITDELNKVITWAKDNVLRKDYFTYIRINFRRLIWLRCTAIMAEIRKYMAQYNESVLAF